MSPEPRSAIRQRPWCADPPAPWRDDAGTTGPTGGKRATKDEILIARCDRLPCWWRGLRPDTRPDCRVPAANGSGRILWTRRSNEDWPTGCPLDDPSFAAAVSTCSPTWKGAIASLIHRPRSWNGARGHVPHLNSPGGAFRSAVHPVCLNRQREQWGALRVCVVSRLAVADYFLVFAGESSTSNSASGFFNNPEDISGNHYFVCLHQSCQ